MRTLMLLAPHLQINQLRAELAYPSLTPDRVTANMWSLTASHTVLVIQSSTRWADFQHADTYEWIDIKHGIDEIKCVTEAVSRSSRTKDSFENTRRFCAVGDG